MNRAFYPGSFDPITNGHVDIIERSLASFNKLVVGVSVGEGKQPLFSMDERYSMAREVLAYKPEIEVITYGGLTVEAAKSAGCNVIIRGLRVISDFDYEMQLALMNKSLVEDIETVFLVSSSRYIYVSSSVIKEIAKHGSDVSRFVPEIVERKLKRKFSESG